MSFPRSNCTMMRDDPCELHDEISLTPAMVPSARSSGVATLEAIVSGLAPGSPALTEMTGKSTCGRGETASIVNATAPASTIDRLSSVVVTGRRMKGDERLIGPSRSGVARDEPRRARGPAASQPIEEQVDDGRREEGQHLADEQSADHDQAERVPEFCAGAGCEHQRQRAEERGEGRHQDGPEPEQCRLIDGLLGGHAL